MIACERPRTIVDVAKATTVEGILDCFDGLLVFVDERFLPPSFQPTFQHGRGYNVGQSKNEDADFVDKLKGNECNHWDHQSTSIGGGRKLHGVIFRC